jgi:phosphoenolpyruvate carboxylase
MRPLRPQAIRHYIISHTEAVSDLLEAMLLQKEVGLLRGTLDDHAIADLIVVPLFETIEDLRNAAPIMREFYACPASRSSCSAPAPSRTSCWATATATRTAASSPATGSCTAPRSRW